MKRILALFLFCALLLLLCSLHMTDLPEMTSLSENFGNLTVHYIDVGQANCILLLCNGRSMLIDGGNTADSDLVVAYLQKLGLTKLNYVVNTHVHEDHVGGLPAVLAVYETEHLWCPVTEYDSECFADFLYYADQQALTPVCPTPGDVYPLGGTQITVLGPVAEDPDSNNSSIILRADYGQTSFLFSGDAELEAETAVLDAGFDIACTVMTAGHHGSGTSSSYRWLREANPAYAVISVGTDNAYGHPHTEALSRFRDAGVRVYRTDLQGHIVCTSDGSAVTFSTEKYAAVTNPTEKADRYFGNRNSLRFHLSTCSGLPEEDNRVEFRSCDEAEQAGYIPCGNCIG